MGFFDKIGSFFKHEAEVVKDKVGDAVHAVERTAENIVHSVEKTAAPIVHEIEQDVPRIIHTGGDILKNNVIPVLKEGAQVGFDYAKDEVNQLRDATRGITGGITGLANTVQYLPYIGAALVGLLIWNAEGVGRGIERVGNSPAVRAAVMM